MKKEQKQQIEKEFKNRFVGEESGFDDYLEEDTGEEVMYWWLAKIDELLEGKAREIKELKDQAKQEMIEEIESKIPLYNGGELERGREG